MSYQSNPVISVIRCFWQMNEPNEGCQNQCIICLYFVAKLHWNITLCHYKYTIIPWTASFFEHLKFLLHVRNTRITKFPRKSLWSMHRDAIRCRCVIRSYNRFLRKKIVSKIYLVFLYETDYLVLSLMILNFTWWMIIKYYYLFII